MSRIGKKSIPVPPGVKVAISGRTVSVEGPKGKLTWTHRAELAVTVDAAGKTVVVTRAVDDRVSRSLHGMTRTLIANMIEGCTQGYSRKLEVYGVGFSVQVQGQKLTLNCGFSHPVVFEIPSGLSVEVQTPQARGDNEPARFAVSGAHKQAVGEFAAAVRRARPPEPYKGKGVRYAGERVRRKVGKAFVGTTGT
jgi:large subunit ribosomal protein L6